MAKTDRGREDVGELANWLLESDVTTRAKYASDNLENPDFERFTGVERGFARRRVDVATIERLSTVGIPDGAALTGERTAAAIGTLSINSRLSRLGVSYIGVDNIDDYGMAIFETDPVPYWLHEGESVTPTECAMARLSLGFKTVAVGIALSRRLMRLSGDGGLRSFGAAIVRSLSREIDRVALIGDGNGPEPLGIVNHPIDRQDVSATNFDTAFWNAVRDLELSGINSEAVSIVSHPNTAAQLRDLPDISSVRSDWTMERGRQTFRGFPFLSTPNFRENSLLIGDFSKVVVRLDSAVDMRILDSTRSDGAHEIYSFLDCAIECPQAELSFVELTNVFPS